MKANDTCGKRLDRLAREMKRTNLESCIGRRFPVLVEGRARGDGAAGHWFGYTPNFLNVVIPAEPERNLENRILAVKLSGITDTGEALTGRP